MQLELTIAGLCLLAADSTMDAVHVLMPATGYGHGGDEHAHHGPMHPPHQARFVYPLCTDRESDEITGYSFDLRCLVHTGITGLTIPPEVFDITTVCQTIGHVDRSTVQSKQPSRLAAMLTLGGGRLTMRDKECCLVDGTQYMVAGHVVWTAHVSDFPLPLYGCPITSGERPLILHPRADDGVLRIGLVHSTADDMPLTLDALHQTHSSKFDHFSAFYPLVNSHSTKVPTACVSRGPSQCMGTRAIVA